MSSWSRRGRAGPVGWRGRRCPGAGGAIREVGAAKKVGTAGDASEDTERQVGEVQERSGRTGRNRRLVFYVCFNFIFLHLGIAYGIIIALDECPDRFSARRRIYFDLCLLIQSRAWDLIIICVGSRLFRRFVRTDPGVDSLVSV